MRGNILYRLIYSGVLQRAQFYLFTWLFWRTLSTLKIAKSSPPRADKLLKGENQSRERKQLNALSSTGSILSSTDSLVLRLRKTMQLNDVINTSLYTALSAHVRY